MSDVLVSFSDVSDTLDGLLIVVQKDSISAGTVMTGQSENGYYNLEFVYNVLSMLEDHVAKPSRFTSLLERIQQLEIKVTVQADKIKELEKELEDCHNK